MFSLELRLPFLTRTTKLLLVALAGLSVSILAGYLLNRHRRRYRAVTSTSSDSHLSRKETFRTNNRLASFQSFPGVGSYHQGSLQSHAILDTSVSLSDDDGSDADMFVDSFDLPLSADLPLERTAPQPWGGYVSDSSEDSFHSTMESLDPFEVSNYGQNHLYVLGVQEVECGLVQCRTIRTGMLACSSDDDFLAKLHCVRLAFDELFCSQASKEYIKQAARDAMATFLRSANEDPTLFCERFEDLTEFLEQESGWAIAKQELTDRRVVCMSVYDIALDFVLLDAFDDLDHPPSTVVSVLQNRWITDGMKKAALSAAVWSLLKAKKSLLKNKDGFMSRFYLLTETLTPVLAWGFLGTDDQLKEQCLLFRGRILLFLRTIFSVEGVRYTSAHTLAEDILHLAQRTVEPLRTN